MPTNSTLTFFLIFLALCADCGCQNQTADPDLSSNVPCECQKSKQRREVEPRPTISSSSLFQDASTDMTLQCNPAPGNDAYSSELIFNHNNGVLYNSTLKRENGVARINATAIQFPSQNLRLSNLTCAYGNSLSSNSLDIPYLNIDKFQVCPKKLKLNQTSTVSCKVALDQNPANYTVRFLLKETSNFEFKQLNGEIFWFNLENSDFRNKIELKRAGHLIVSEYPVYSAIFAIDVINIGYKYKKIDHDYNNRFLRVLENDNTISSIQCELQYGDNEQLAVRSNQYSISVLPN